jgi:hypothetical protein
MNENPIYIDSQAMLENTSGMEAVGIAMDLVMLMWWPSKQPFEFNAKELAARLRDRLPARGYSEDALMRNYEGIKSFFTELPDGKWAPSPTYFSMSNGNPGSAS